MRKILVSLLAVTGTSAFAAAADYPARRKTSPFRGMI
jgi:hypothetical protein